MAEVVLLPDRVPSLGRAVEQFLAAKPLSPNAHRSYAYCLGAVVADLGAGAALGDVTPETPARGPRAAMGQRSSGDVEQSSGRGGVVPPLGTGTELGQRRSAGGDRTPTAGARRHHTGPLRTAARPVDPGGYPRSGEDTVADAVRNRGPGLTRYSPSTSRTST